VNDGLIDSIRHNAWATREVLRVCRELTPAQLETTVTGTYGSILATLRHLVGSEAGYCRRLTGHEPDGYRRAGDAGLDELARFHDDLADRWERFLATPFDAERTFIIEWHDGHDRDVPAGVVLVQALHHGNEHRTQVCTTLTSIGVTPPELGVWEFAEATNRAPRRAR
jgi:uncharacterized damage-inducible protein DinB